MKKKEKQGLLILVVVVILVIGLIWFLTRSKDTQIDTNNDSKPGTSTSQGEYTKVEEDGTVVNTSEKLNSNKEELGYAITNIKFEEKNGETTFSARVTNNTGSSQQSFLANIVLLDRSGKEMGKIPVMLSDMQNGEAIDVEAIIDENYINAYDFKLVK